MCNRLSNSQAKEAQQVLQTVSHAASAQICIRHLKQQSFCQSAVLDSILHALAVLIAFLTYAELLNTTQATLYLLSAFISLAKLSLCHLYLHGWELSPLQSLRRLTDCA